MSSTTDESARALGWLSTLSMASILALVLLVGSLSWHWNEKLLASHHHRQAQTATNVETYQLQGWDPFSNISRFIPRPGIFMLELPIYQSLALGAVKVTGLSIAQVCKLINSISGLLYALGIVALFRQLCPRETRTSLGLVLSLPLLFGISQWVLPDMLGCALGIWALLLFFKAGKPGAGALVASLGFGLCLAASFAIKPTVFLATVPFYLFALWDRGRVQFKPVTRLIAGVLAVGLGLAWFWYAHVLNERFGSPFKLSDPAYYLGDLLKSPIALGKFAARLTFYVVGPGTILALAVGLLRTHRKLQAPARDVAWACAASFGLYLGVFANLNVRHNYYQLPLLIPVGLALLWFANQVAKTMPAWPVLVAVAVAGNIVLAEVRLLRNDPQLDALVEGLRSSIPPGVERPDVRILSNADVGAVLSYYLQRWVVEFPLERFKKEGAQGNWLAVCDESQDSTCRVTALAQAPACADRARVIGRFWTCIAQTGGVR